MDKENEARDIAEMIGGSVQRHTADDGLRTFSIETDDQSVIGSGMSDEEAWADLVRAADEVGWRLEE